MFRSLQDEIDSTEGREPVKERVVRWALVVFGSVMSLGGLYLAITALE